MKAVCAGVDRRVGKGYNLEIFLFLESGWDRD
jgi:hypothetical protein